MWVACITGDDVACSQISSIRQTECHLLLQRRAGLQRKSTITSKSHYVFSCSWTSIKHDSYNSNDSNLFTQKHAHLAEASVSQNNRQPADKHLCGFIRLNRNNIMGFILTYSDVICILQSLRSVWAITHSRTEIYAIIFTHSTTMHQIKTNTPEAFFKTI